MDKDKLRKEFLKKRQYFLSFKKSSDQKIFEQFINLPIVQKSKTICFYVSKEGEVDTRKLIKYFLEENFSFTPSRCKAKVQGCKPKKRVVVPKVVGQNLELYEIKSFADLSLGSFGILEPNTQSSSYPIIQSSDHQVSPVDLFIIPGLAFSKSGQRLGFGKGYYDRLLKKIKGFKLGLAYSWQIVDKLPEEKDDVLMDMILTEQSFIVPRCAG